MFRRGLRGEMIFLIVASATKRDKEQALRELHFCFPIKDLEEPFYYPGYNIKRDRGAGTVKVNQLQYVQDIAGRFRITNTSAIPYAAGGKALSKANGPETGTEADEVPYRKAVKAPVRAATMANGQTFHAPRTTSPNSVTTRSQRIG